MRSKLHHIPIFINLQKSLQICVIQYIAISRYINDDILQNLSFELKKKIKDKIKYQFHKSLQSLPKFWKLQTI